MARRFVFVPGSWSADELAVCCDGIVPGAALQLSHWQGNRTPVDLKADTSTEIALRFVDSEQSERWADAPVLNNHFDTDGVLSVWTLLHPNSARDRRELLVAAAEAGDFDAWHDDPRGFWVDAAVRALGTMSDADATAYERALGVLPALLDDIETHQDLWGAEWQLVQAAERDVEGGRIVIERMGAVGVVHHRSGAAEIPGPLLARYLGTDCTRYLLVFERDRGLDYRYELPHWAWADTVVRPQLASPDTSKLLEQLGPDWTDADLRGMTEVARTRKSVQQSLETVLEALQNTDAALASPPAA